jgi:hypothetical protein
MPVSDEDVGPWKCMLHRTNSSQLCGEIREVGVASTMGQHYWDDHPGYLSNFSLLNTTTGRRIELSKDFVPLRSTIVRIIKALVPATATRETFREVDAVLEWLRPHINACGDVDEFEIDDLIEKYKREKREDASSPVRQFPSSQNGGTPSTAPTKRKQDVKAAQTQKLLNARLEKKQKSVQRELVLEMGNIEKRPDHERLLEICRMGSIRGEEDYLSTTQLRDISSFRSPMIKAARIFLMDNLLKKPGFSEEEQELHITEAFKLWYGFARKPGRKALSPDFMVALALFIKHKLYVERNFDCVTDLESFWQHIVIACGASRGTEIPELKETAQYSIFKSLCPKEWRGKGKWAVKHRQVAMSDPCGAISMTAAWAIISEGVHNYLKTFWDKCTHLLGNTAPVRCRVPKDIQELMTLERRTPTFTRGMGQERSFGITVGLEKSCGLLSCTFHICDETIQHISCEPMCDRFHVMFEPYSAKSEERARGGREEQAMGGHAEGGNAEDDQEESLAKRTANKWITEVQIPALKAHRQKLRDDAIANNVSAECYKAMIISCDGEQSHLHSMMDRHAAALAEDDAFGIKLSAGHSNNIAVPDVAPIFPILHTKLIKGMRQATPAEIDAIILDEPGIARVIQILMGIHGMSNPSKETFKTAIVLAYGIVKATVNVSTVSKGCKDACMIPFNRVKMIEKMWPFYKTLPADIKEFVLQTIDGPVSAEIRQSGWCRSSLIETLIKARETTIVFPPRAADFDRFQWNRQTAVLFGHPAVLAEHQRRRVNVVVAAAAAVQVQHSKQEKQARLLFRKTKCTVGPDATTGKTKCGCGRIFDGINGFKTHETSDHHERHYSNRNWEQEYIASLPPVAPLPPAIAPGV